MTLYVHRSASSVGYGDHRHDRPAKVDGRAWSFSCEIPGCEDRVLRDLAHVASRTPGGVPLTPDEDADRQATDEQSQREVSKLTRALGQLVREEAATGSK